MRRKFMRGTIAAAVLAVATLMASPCLAQRSHMAKMEMQGRFAAQRQGARASQGHAGDWLRHYQGMSPGERERALQNDPGFRRLPPDRQQQLRQRLQHFYSLPPQQQQRVLDRMETWEHLTPAQKQEARDVFGRLQQLPPNRRRMVTTAIRDLGNMPPGQREQIIDSPRFRGMFSPDERDMMRRSVQLPFAPSEGRPEENVPSQ
jgi:hypothetical protein